MYVFKNKLMSLIFADVDPCEEGRLQCSANSACVVDQDTFRCVCNPGYQQLYSVNETLCADIDECQSGLHNCDYNARCINEIGSYSCHCNPGFTGNGQICENEFSCRNVLCPPDSICVENNRVANCVCIAGFTGDGQTCLPIIDHSCHTANNCDHFAVCTINQTSNTYYCDCLPGYEGDGYSCERIEQTTTEEIYRETSPCPEGYLVELGTNICVLAPETTTLPVTTTALSTNSKLE